MIRLKKSRNTIEMRVTYVFEWKLLKRESRKHTENVTCSKIYLRIPYTVSSYLLLPFSGFRGRGAGGVLAMGDDDMSQCVCICVLVYLTSHTTATIHQRRTCTLGIFTFYITFGTSLSVTTLPLFTCLPYREQLMGVRGCSSIHVRLYSK